MKICCQCSKLIKNKYNKFCNSSCAATFTNTQRKPMSEAVKQKISISLKKAYVKSPELKEAICNRNKLKRNIKFCKSCTKECGPRIYCSRNCYLIGAAERALRAIGTGSGKKGYYKGIYCQSTFELAFVYWAIDQNKNIKRCSTRIPYFFAQKLRTYNPDFEVDGEIFEIKGYINAIAKAKFKAAYDIGIDLIIIDPIKIKWFIEYVKQSTGLDVRKDYKLIYS